MESILTRKVWTIVGKTGGDVHFVSKVFEELAEANTELSLLRQEQPDLSFSLVEDESIIPDTTLPTEEQRKELCDLFYHAFVAMRQLAHYKNHEAVYELADTFHNLPQEMYKEGVWDWNLVEFCFRSFEDKFPEEKVFPFAAMLRTIKGRAEQAVPPKSDRAGG